MSTLLFPNTTDFPVKTTPSSLDPIMIADSEASSVLKQTTIWGIPNYFAYQITPSISWGNLTIAFKNYNWDNASANAPVKQQIWDTIRTLTSSLSVVANAATSYLNMWSSELATKEVDLFVYLQWNSTTNAINLLISRVPYASTMADFSNSNTLEKWAIWIINYNSSNKVVCIWRFTAILSAWAWYTWSTPSWWFDVRNYPIYETDWLDWTSVTTWFSSVSVNWYRYKINWNKIDMIFKEVSWVSNWTNLLTTLPFTPAYFPSYSSCFVQDNGSYSTTPWCFTFSSNYADVRKTFFNWAFTNSWNKSVYFPNFNYSI